MNTNNAYNSYLPEQTSRAWRTARPPADAAPAAARRCGGGRPGPHLSLREQAMPLNPKPQTLNPKQDLYNRLSLFSRTLLPRKPLPNSHPLRNETLR